MPHLRLLKIEDCGITARHHLEIAQMVTQSNSNKSLESFHLIGGEVDGVTEEALFQFLDLIQDNLPCLFEFSWSSSCKPTPHFIARYL